MKPELFRIEPEFSPRIWGARSLAPLYPQKAGLPEPIGEAWLTGRDCRVATGPFAGRALRQAWQVMPVAWRGTRLGPIAEFPLLAKFIFPNDKLSIQVHPDDAYAEQHEAAAGGRGKTEMWYAVAADPGAHVLIGLRPGVDRAAFLFAQSARRLEELFESWPVHAGDAFFIPARTPHTIGPGMILCEVQEYSDLTYRVYDYGRVDAEGRPRELHIEKALDVMRFGTSAGGKLAPLPLRLPRMHTKKSLLAACRYFAVERWEFASAVDAQSDPQQFDALIVLDGHGEFEWAGGAEAYDRGEAWFVPAALGPFRVVPNGTTLILRACVPDIASLRGELRRSGAVDAEIAGVVFD